MSSHPVRSRMESGRASRYDRARARPNTGDRVPSATSLCVHTGRRKGAQHVVEFSSFHQLLGERGEAREGVIGSRRLRGWGRRT